MKVFFTMKQKKTILKYEFKERGNFVFDLCMNNYEIWLKSGVITKRLYLQLWNFLGEEVWIDLTSYKII